MEKYDFSGWATRNDLQCSDGRIIRKDAFKHCDGMTVPLVWGHQHNESFNVLGHALLENREDGVYTYGKFNDTEQGKNAKLLVEHGDIVALSIYANQLQQQGPNVIHGAIREVSLVLAGANPGAFIEEVIMHSDDGEPTVKENEGILYTGEEITIAHGEESESVDEVEEVEEVSEDESEEVAEDTSEEVLDDTLEHSDEKDDPEKSEDSEEDNNPKKGRTIQEIFEDMTEEQKMVVYVMLGQVLSEQKAENEKEEIKHSEGGNEIMKTNVFDQVEVMQENTLSHADQEKIMELAKKTSVGSFKEALRIFAEENGDIAHGLDLGDAEVLKELLPDYKNITPGAPEVLGPDQSWVMDVINKIHKSPYSRIRTRQADARANEIREKLKAKGYTKAEEKKLIDHIKLLGRSFDPQTVYVKDELNRDDINDITDFDIVGYHWNLMNAVMYETLALAALISDGREDTDPDKIKEDHIRSIWHDDELYTIHADVDFEAMKKELQGTNTSANFGEEFIYAEAIIKKSLYAREQFKGSGRPDFYCTPHLVNVMLLARDLNGRRIYDSKADLAKALNVGAIHEIEQFEGKTRTTEGGATKKLLGLFVNLADYQFGSTKGGEVTKFTDFDIDFNKYKYLMETRLSGALIKPYAAIALEEPVSEEAAG